MRRKYSKALRSLCATPSPSAYMRPSFHCASAWPFSAAYSSDCTALAVSPALSDCAPERKACAADIGPAAATVASVLLPSKASAGAADIKVATSNARANASGIRIAALLGRAARMRHRAFERVAHLLAVFPQIARAVFALARLPLRLALG